MVRVDQLQERFGDAIAVEWKAFLLRPESKTRDLEAFVTYTESWARPAAMEPSIVFQRWASENPAPTGSLPAQIVAKAMDVVAPDAAARFHRALMTAYFEHNRTISEWTVLGDIAEECGVDRETFLAKVRDEQQEFAGMVIDEHNEALAAGVTAVPTVVLDDILPVPGAQELETYVTWIDRLIQRRTPA